jgi:hypothetical protein
MQWGELALSMKCYCYVETEFGSRCQSGNIKELRIILRVRISQPAIVYSGLGCGFLDPQNYLEVLFQSQSQDICSLMLTRRLMQH